MAYGDRLNEQAQNKVIDYHLLSSSVGKVSAISLLSKAGGTGG